jgi:putative PIN family toxin of toxin-antitoxin system
MRVVLDTNIFVAGLASRTGASHQLLLAVFEGRLRPLVSVPLFLEYEATLKRSDIRSMHGISNDDLDALLHTLAAGAEPIDLHFLWRPQLSDPKDEMVLETALNGRADALVTFNIADFRLAAERFALPLMRPADLLTQLRRTTS